MVSLLYAHENKLPILPSSQREYKKPNPSMAFEDGRIKRNVEQPPKILPRKTVPDLNRFLAWKACRQKASDELAACRGDNLKPTHSFFCRNRDKVELHWNRHASCEINFRIRNIDFEGQRLALVEAGRGGRGFNSFRRGRPLTAPTLMRRFFSWPKTFDFFSRNHKFKRPPGRFQSTKQCSSTRPTFGLGHYFSRPSHAAFRKNVAKFGGEGQP